MKVATCFQDPDLAGGKGGFTIGVVLGFFEGGKPLADGIAIAQRDGASIDPQISEATRAGHRPRGLVGGSPVLWGKRSITIALLL